MWSVAEHMNSGFWSDWIREGVDTLGYPNLAEESFVSHIPCTESDTAPALLNNGYDLLHVLQSKSNISGNFQAFLNPLNIRTWAF